MADIPEHQEYVRRARVEKELRSPFLPKGKSFLTDSAILRQRCIFSFRPLIFSVMITSKDITESLKILYDIAWQSAEPYEKYYNRTYGIAVIAGKARPRRHLANFSLKCCGFVLRSPTTAFKILGKCLPACRQAGNLAQTRKSCIKNTLAFAGVFFRAIQ